MSQRGVSLKSFDGRTLTAHYDAEADTELLKGHLVNVSYDLFFQKA